ncbi:hypothetical protein R1flu_022484 [Riccia fluitans]|uniref:HECT-type E3 ubiquitin transferase n=1 Tax=Riccia fluitans TaxID=41844 RepID=A0ABD1XPA8_9MARC
MRVADGEAVLESTAGRLPQLAHCDYFSPSAMQHSGRGPKVSLRGASAKEVSRDALLEKVAQERASRLLIRKSAAAAVFIQRVWRGRKVACELAEREGADWDAEIKDNQQKSRSYTADDISRKVLRPFLFLLNHPSGRSFDCPRGAKNARRIDSCFKLLLDSISATDLRSNYCSLVIGSVEEQSLWVYQTHKILELCSAVLANDGTGWTSSQRQILPGLAVRVMVALTDASMWKALSQPDNLVKANVAVLSLLEWLIQGSSGLYPAIRSYVLSNFPVPKSSTDHNHPPERDKFIVTASAITMALRPINALSAALSIRKEVNEEVVKLRESSARSADVFVAHILTIPFLIQRIPPSLIPALQHPSALAPCLRSLGVPGSGQKFGASTSSRTGQIEQEFDYFPRSLWALANLVSLVSGSGLATSKCKEMGSRFVKGLDLGDYVKALCCLLSDLSPWIESKQQQQRFQSRYTSEDSDEIDGDQLDIFMGIHRSPIDDGDDDDNRCNDFPAVLQLLRDNLKSFYQSWHLQQLLEACKSSSFSNQNNYETQGLQTNAVPTWEPLGLLEVAKLYSSLLAAFTAFKLSSGPCPILDVLALSQSLFPLLWDWLTSSLNLPSSVGVSSKAAVKTSRSAGTLKDGSASKTTGGKWAAAAFVLRMRTKGTGADGSSTTDKGSSSRVEKVDPTRESEVDQGVSQLWSFESMQKGPAGIPADAVPVLTLFCAAYAHLLVVMDDEQFYERQFPFTLEQQRVIAAMLNTMVYNGLMAPSKGQNAALMDAAVRCLRSLYERDCRRSFCDPALWLAPAVSLDLPIANAARLHREGSASGKMRDFFQASGLGGVLTTIPHVLPFEKRVHIFRDHVKQDKMLKRMGGEAVGPGPGTIEIAVRRDHIVEDGFAQLNGLGSKLKSCINVSFVNELGLSEAGLDYGGLFKEFLTNLAKAALDPGYGLFVQTATEEGLLYPHSAASSLGHGLQMIEFLGQIIGKALYEGILLEYSFSPLFVSKLLGRSSFLDDLSSLDVELHRNLMYLKRYEDDARDLALDFTITQEIFGKLSVVELRPGGADIAVTNENKLAYVYAMADYKLNRQMRPAIQAFIKGLSDLIAPSWLGLFSAKEFNQLLSGGEHDFDVDDLRAHTRYTGGFTDSSRTVRLFWEVVTGFEAHERCALLKFVTSCSRAPLLGFKHLQPAFTIHKVVCDAPVWAIIGGPDVERLPSASTCYNTLKLPTYKRLSTLREKLRYAICSNAGFELS